MGSYHRVHRELMKLPAHNIAHAGLSGPRIFFFQFSCRYSFLNAAVGNAAEAAVQLPGHHCAFELINAISRAVAIVCAPHG
jgi:hypothetical protein